MDDESTLDFMAMVKQEFLKEVPVKIEVTGPGISLQVWEVSSQRL